jgi:hypothetical protein
MVMNVNSGKNNKYLSRSQIAEETLADATFTLQRHYYLFNTTGKIHANDAYNMSREYQMDGLPKLRYINLFSKQVVEFDDGFTH